MTLEARFIAIVRETNWLMGRFRRARELALPDWWIVSGALYNTVWNRLTGRPLLHGIKDVDLFYFDLDTSWEAEDRIIRRAATLFPDAPLFEIRNQARVHLRYEERFGHAYPPLGSVREAIHRFACLTHCVGLRLREDDGFDLYAPHGLDLIFGMCLVRTHFWTTAPRTRQRPRVNAPAGRNCRSSHGPMAAPHRLALRRQTTHQD